MTSNYTSIKSVIYDLSNTMDDRYWNEAKAMEWAHRAARLIFSDQLLETKVTYLEVCEHKAVLPSNLKYLTHIMYKESATLDTVKGDIAALHLPSNSSLALDASYIQWKAMRLTSNPYHASICLDETIMHCTDCQHEFSVSSDLVLTTTLRTGIIMISYLAYPVDEEGFALIPDNEHLKEAILHYILYRYWMNKSMMMEEGSAQRLQFHLKMWNDLSKKAAGDLNKPDVNELENLKSQMNRLVPRQNRFQQGFITLGNRENVNF